MQPEGISIANYIIGGNKVDSKIFKMVAKILNKNKLCPISTPTRVYIGSYKSCRCTESSQSIILVDMIELVVNLKKSAKTLL